jgi:hypothetical protein
MCMACEQDAIWLAYLESKGLLNPDDPAAVEALFSSFPVQLLPVQQGANEQPETAPAKITAANPFSCDDPTNG